MGIYLINRSKPGQIKKNPKIALVLAGGALSGGAFKLGGLCALNSYLRNIKITDFSIYSGISAGALLASPIAAGIPPEEMVKSLFGLSNVVNRFKPFDFYYPNISEMAAKGSKVVFDALKFVPGLIKTVNKVAKRDQKKIFRLIKLFVSKRDYHSAMMLIEPFIKEVIESQSLSKGGSYLISGIFSNKRLEKYIRKNLEKNKIPNNFRLFHKATNKSLYIISTDINEAKSVVFGWDEDNRLTISEAVQASTALPVLYKPARIGNHEFADAAVVKTAHINLAVEKGADLVIAYNPFRPIVSSAIDRLHPDYESIGYLGLITILNQAFRLMLHSRMKLSLKLIEQDPNFHGDVIVFEPMETDSDFFVTNPFAFWKLAPSAKMGFESIKKSIEKHNDILKTIFYNYQIETDMSALKKDFDEIKTSKLEDRLLVEKMGQKKIPRRMKHIRVIK